MSNIHIKKEHALDQRVARQRVEAIARELQEEYKIDYVWQDERLIFKRKGVAGFLYLGDGFIEIKMNLGMALTPLRGRIEKSIMQTVAAEMSAGPGTTGT
jgi:putative polyhydroxyalkanoate system protein